jgi:hypothetical protein
LNSVWEACLDRCSSRGFFSALIVQHVFQPDPVFPIRARWGKFDGMTPTAFLSLFADEPKRTAPFLQKSEDWIVVGLLTGTLLAAAAILWFVERWRKRSLGASPRDAFEEMTSYRQLYERGEITEEEYNKLRDRVAGAVKSPAAKPPPGPAPQPPPAPPEPPPNGQAPPA